LCIHCMKEVVLDRLEWEDSVHLPAA
jgi:hypothetical protein